jgi:hypothetical protein
MSSLFEPAEKQATRLKMLIYGATGTGKSVASLHFPNCAVIDAEKGTEYYGEFFDFERIKTANPTMVKKAIDELLEDPRDRKTLVVDPFTNIYDQIILGFTKKMAIKNGKSDYVLQPLDYRHIKAEVKYMVNKMLALDMNIIVTAKSKTLYSSEDGDFMKVIGTQPDVPKDMPFMFDVVIELYNEGTKHMAIVEKDRTNRLPKDKPFEFSYASFTKYLGNETLEREPVVFNQQQALEDTVGRHAEIKFKGKALKTAGVQAGTLMALEKITKKVGEKATKKRLATDYSVNSVLDLKEDEAILLINDLTKDNTDGI